LYQLANAIKRNLTRCVK